MTDLRPGGRPRGRPKGTPKTGGRKKGTPNKVKSKKRLVEEAHAAGLETPLDLLERWMRDESLDVGVRLNAAKAAAPYRHPQRKPVDSTGDDTVHVVHEVVLSFG